MNKTQFKCVYNNKNRTSGVKIEYIKNNSKHTITVNKSGYVKHSGPGFELMKPVYYLFMKRVIENYTQFKLITNDSKILKIKNNQSITIAEFKQIIAKEQELRNRIINDHYAVIESTVKVEQPINVIYESNEDKVLNNVTFDYVPLSLT